MVGAINLENTTYKTGFYPVFLGERLGIYDSINVTYPEMHRLYKLQKAQDWDENEMNLDQTRKDFTICSENNYDVMIKNLSFQWENDSLAKSIITLFAPFLSNNEACAMMMKQSEIEVLHALTYSEIIRQCVPNPNEVIDQIMENSRIFDRMGVVEEVMSELFIAGHKYALGELEADDSLRLIILKGMIALIALEGIQFISSFSATFALAEQQLFVNACKLIQKIMLDEILHVKMDYEIIDALLKDPEWKKVYDENIDALTAILDTVIAQEEDWCDYLYSEGRVIVGLNAHLSKQWVYFNAAPIYRRLKMKHKFKAPKQTPLPWMDKWLNPDMIQAAAQEIQLTNYKLNSTNNDFDEDEELEW
ncbi:ribonucleotide reductase of class Ia (aerobic), beta subunit [Citrobacter phage Tr1]|nr:ribonucleotide reductase of class Ia (aerobic), beta subunit [Citrobacter phage Tr1]